MNQIFHGTHAQFQPLNSLLVCPSVGPTDSLSLCLSHAGHPHPPYKHGSLVILVIPDAHLGLCRVLLRDKN